MSFIDHIKQNIKDGSIVHVGGYDMAAVAPYVTLANDLSRECIVIGPFLDRYETSHKDSGCKSATSFPKQNDFIKTWPKIKIVKDTISNFLARVPAKIALVHINAVNYLTMKQTLSAMNKIINAGYLTVIPFNSATCGADLAVTEFLSSSKLNFNIIDKNVVINNKTLMSSMENVSVNVEQEEIIIATVLKSGGIYTTEYANNLAKAIKKHSTAKHKLVCISDLPRESFSDDYDEIIAFDNDWPKWWGKIELFKKSFYDGKRVVYFDMDTIICANIDWLLNYRGPFMALLDFYTKTNIGSAVMAWRSGDYSHVYDNFYLKYKAVISTYSQGDQRWIGEQIPKSELVQSRFPNQVVSFKAHCVKKKTYVKTDNISIPEQCSVICFHGEPRIHSIENTIIKNMWNSIDVDPTDITDHMYNGNGVAFGKVNISSNHENIIIIGSGKSLKDFDFNTLRDIPNTFIITVNGAGTFVPFADAWFTLDPWGLTTTQCPRNFAGVKYAAVPEDYGTTMARQKNHKVVARNDVVYLHRLCGNNYSNRSSLHAYKFGLSEDSTCINTGNSGYGALNLAYHMRPKNIILLGIDAGSGYFYESTKSNGPLDLLPKLFDSAQHQLNLAKINVYNGSTISQIDCFTKYDPVELIQKVKHSQL